jgi:hypothetical protein
MMSFSRQWRLWFLRAYEIGLSAIEEMYGKIPYNILQGCRVNHTIPLYGGVEKKTQEPMANWALDGIIELMQKYYHKMNFANTLEGWTRHSGNVALIAKSIQFTTNEYPRAVDANTFNENNINLKDDRDAGRNKRYTTTPQRQKERLMVAELHLLSLAVVEQPQRKYTRGFFWDNFKDIRTDLKLETVEERARRLKAECQSEGEQLLSDMTDELYNDDEDDGQIRNETSGGGNEPLTMINPATIGADGNEDDDKEGDDDDIDNGETTSSNTGAEEPIEVSIGKRRIMNIRRAAVHKFAFRDVEAMGKEAMRKADLKKTRFRARERKQRQEATLFTLLANEDSNDRNATLTFRWLATSTVAMKPNFLL